MPLGAFRLNTLSKPQGSAPLLPWEVYDSSTFSLAQYGVTPNSMTLHGVVNTNQLVGSMIYVESSGGGSSLFYKLRGFVVDLNSGGINVGSAINVAECSTYAGGTYKGAIGSNGGNLGLISYVTTASYYSQVRGFTISNYSSCNQSTAPTFTLGGTTLNLYTGGNTLGDALAIGYVSGTTYVAVTRGNDVSTRGAYTWNGSSLALSGTTYRAGISGGGYGNAAAFANPGNSLSYGFHLFGTDPNGNQFYVNQKASNTVDQALQFYATTGSSVNGNGVKIQDQAGACRSLVVARQTADAFLSFKVATTSNFTSTTGTSYGSVATTTAIGTGVPQLSTNGTGSKVWAWYKPTSSTLGALPITISGTSITLGTTPESVASSNFASGGLFTVRNYTDATYGEWHIFLNSASGNSGKITAVKHNEV